MNTEELINAWKAEERIAHIHGWKFSHIRERYTGGICAVSFQQV